MFSLTVISPKEILFAGDANRLFVPGDTGEFELLSHHAPIVSMLVEGNLLVDGKQTIPIKKGIIKFFNNDCIALVEA